MSNNDVTEFVIDCLTDAGNRDKQAALNKWLEQSEENRHLYAELKQLWEAAAEVPAMPFNVQEGWSELSQEITPPAKIKRMFPWRMAVAAAILLAVGVGMWWWQMGNRNVWVTYTGKQVARDSVILRDGSIVYVRPGSTISYQEAFITRTVKLLNGEAYFNVAKDPQRQFTVEAEQSVVKVLGTAFNVRIDPNYTEVVVFEGKVSLNKGTKQLILKSGNGNLATIAKDGKMRRLGGDNSNRCVWVTNELVFENEEAQNVSKVLAHYYQMPEGEIAEHLKHKRITVRFHNVSYDEACETLAILIAE